jgi:pyroglutamyl-peptidase
MRKILVTGFTPFGPYQQNPSQLLCQALHGKRIGDALIEAHVLPVEWQSAEMQLQLLLEQQHDWSGIVLTGLAAQREKMSLEAQAVNIRVDRSDSHHQTKIDPDRQQFIINSGLASLRSNVDLQQLESVLLKDHEKIEISLDAGTYLCNFIYYKTLHYLQIHKKNIPALFIHLPQFPQDNFPHNPDFNSQYKFLVQVLEFIQKNSA